MGNSFSSLDFTSCCDIIAMKGRNYMDPKNILSNFHTHSTFCDGDNTPEEIVLKAIEKSFASIGFSGHGYTPHGLDYCMKDTAGYISEVNSLKEKYKNDIQIYLGTEEDATHLVDRSQLDYLIGSYHCVYANGEYLSLDANCDGFKKCLEAFNYDSKALAENYYTTFCRYVKSRKPDIIGHFDLILKFDEMDIPEYFHSKEYDTLAEMYLLDAASSGCIFEVNTGALSRGVRSDVYPRENLLRLLQKSDYPIILSSDSHSVDTLDFAFDETKHYLREIGFRYAFTLFNGSFIKYNLK